LQYLEAPPTRSNAMEWPLPAQGARPAGQEEALYGERSQTICIQWFDGFLRDFPRNAQQIFGVYPPPPSARILSSIRTSVCFAGKHKYSFDLQAFWGGSPASNLSGKVLILHIFTSILFNPLDLRVNFPVKY
jgi:hypothetical protein